MSRAEFPRKLLQQLESLNHNHLMRELSLPQGGVDFYSNNYLGLASSVTESKYAYSGSGGSRLISGNYEAIEELEMFLASFHYAEAALIFPSAYQANIGLFRVLAGKEDTLLYDEHAHASIRDGMLLSYARKQMFRHNDLQDLEKKLQSAEGEKYIVVEGLYSMDGDFAPLEKIAELCRKYSAYLLVDEAHSNGIYGEKGEGIANSKDILEVCIARVYGFGKAIGCQGAAIVGSDNLRNLLINKHRAFIFSTGTSPILINAISANYHQIENAQDSRKLLFSNIRHFNSLFTTLGSSEWNSPIKSIPFPGNENVMKKAAELRELGFEVKGIRSPTVPESTERIRVILHSFNTFEEIENLFNAVESIKMK
ncbi:MAG: aminotransferase class I/II-fold pyridoxal phosphate-dependent enzyme [Bacteroidia bacterium]